MKTIPIEALLEDAIASDPRGCNCAWEVALDAALGALLYSGAPYSALNEQQRDAWTQADAVHAALRAARIGAQHERS